MTLARHRRNERLIVIAIVLAVLALARAAHGQCGELPSSCVSCHATAGERPPRDDVWHRDHAAADLCGRCHGGDPLAPAAADAHLGLIDPLASASACIGCHDDGAARHAAYVARRAEATGTARASDAGGATTLDPSSPPGPSHPTAASSPPRAPNDPLVAALVVGIGALFAVVAIAVEGRRWPRPLAAIRALAQRPAWSPYLAGALLGIVVAISLAVFGRRLSGAGGYQSLAGYPGRAIAPDAMYWQAIVRPGIGWDVWVLIGTFAGAFASAAASRQLAVRWLPDARWIEAFGPRVWRRWLLVFVGTALLSIAAGIAGGCTASLVLSGGAALAPGAFVFMIGMFAGGIPVALLVERRARRGGAS